MFRSTASTARFWILLVGLLALPAAFGQQPIETLLEEAFTQLGAGELDAAETQIEQALELAEQTSDLRGQAQGLFLLGLLQSKEETFDQALAAYRRSFEIFDQLDDRLGAWMVLSVRGEALRLLGRPDEALATLEQSLEMLREIERSDVAISLDSFKMFAHSQGFSTDIFAVVEPYLALFQPLFVRLAEAMTLMRVAVVQRDQDKPEEALATLGQARQLAQPFGVMDAQIFRQKARLETDLGRLDEAAEDYGEALAGARKLSDRRLQVQLLEALGEVETARGRGEAALRLYQQVLELARQAGDTHREAVALNNLGWAYDRSHRFAEAGRHYEAAIAVAERSDDCTNLATSLSNLAGVHLSRGRPEEALPLLEESLTLARALEDPEQLAVTLNTRGEAHRLLARYEEASSDLEQSLEIAVATGNVELEAAVRNNLSVVLGMTSRYREALGHQKRVLELAAEQSDLQSETLARLNVAGTYLYLEHLEEARDHLRKALATARQLADPVLEKAVESRLAMIELKTDRSAAARRRLEASLVVSRRLGDRVAELETLIAIGTIDAVEGQPELALPFLQQALELASEAALPEIQAGAHLSLGAAYLRLGRRSDAVAELEASLEIFEQAGISYGQALSLGGLGVLRHLEGQRQAAVRDLERSAEGLDTIQEEIGVEQLTAAFAAHSPQAIYDVLVYLAAGQERTADAFAYAERARARAFLKQLGNHRIDFRGGAAQELLDRERSLRQRMTVLKRQLAAAWSGALTADPETDRLRQELRQARGSYRSLLLELAESHPETASLLRVDTLDLGQVQSRLDPRTTLITYYVVGPRTLAWVVDREQAHLVKIDLSAAELRRRVARLDSSIRSRGFDPEAAGDLYRRLFAPIEPLIRHHKLIVVPHGVLHSLPFAALWNPQRQRYLVEDYVLTHAPSASVLRYLAGRQSPDQGRLLVLGDPDGTLPHAAAEAETVARLHGTAPRLGREAGESLIHRRAGEIDVLHLAAHGVYDPKDPLFSRIELAPGDDHDGHLEVHEILALDLGGTNLVVLSACNSALGAQSRGDEMVGMTRAFLYAGSPAVVTSLWSVDDAASAELMASFYQNLRQASDTAEALREAQLAVMAQDEWSPPYFWAAFTLNGDSRIPVEHEHSPR